MMMKKPVIGITPSHNTENDDISLRPTYLRAVLAAGGIPVVLPLEAALEITWLAMHPKGWSEMMLFTPSRM